MYCDCGSNSISYPVDRDGMSEIPVTCEGCGNTWYEPNEEYIKQELQDKREEYYDRFR